MSLLAWSTAGFAAVNLATGGDDITVPSDIHPVAVGGVGFGLGLGDLDFDFALARGVGVLDLKKCFSNFFNL